MASLQRKVAVYEVAHSFVKITTIGRLCALFHSSSLPWWLPNRPFPSLSTHGWLVTSWLQKGSADISRAWCGYLTELNMSILGTQTHLCRLKDIKGTIHSLFQHYGWALWWSSVIMVDHRSLSKSLNTLLHYCPIMHFPDHSSVKAIAGWIHIYSLEMQCFLKAWKFYSANVPSEARLKRELPYILKKYAAPGKRLTQMPQSQIWAFVYSDVLDVWFGKVEKWRCFYKVLEV